MSWRNDADNTMNAFTVFLLFISVNGYSAHLVLLWIMLILPAHFWNTAGGIVLGSVAVSAVSADVLPYISVAIKASFLKLGMCNICKTNIAKMFLDFFKI